MKITNLKIKNYKSLKDINVKLSNFTCIIGENNAGKSTFIQTLLLFLKGNKLKEENFYDSSKDILITVIFEGITADDLEILEESHRDKLKKYIKEDGTLKLARRYSHIDYTSKLRNIKLVPIDKKFDSKKITENFKGKKKKQEIQELLKLEYSELEMDKIKEVSTIKKAKELIYSYMQNLSLENFAEKDVDLESGFDNTIKAFFPEPIYIPAVKDLSNEMKTKDSASFGKLLNILLDVIEDDLNDTKEIFEGLREKLNRVEHDDGTISDNRIQKVIDIEEKIQKNLSETFKNVNIEIEIPPPEIKTILSSATIVANDGVKGSIEHKGDGFKRAITFSILRSYVELSNENGWQKEGSKSKQKDNFLFLFEEPELYLHPHAQNILFEALAFISEHNQVLVTTHSPLFLTPDKTKTFIKIKRQSEKENPFSTANYIDLTEMKYKDKFQLISFETSNNAFFSNKIVLVEGDSELIVLPHIAKLVNSKYDFKHQSISLIKTGGKGSFKRYIDFFKNFDIDIFMIADLDVLTSGFKLLGVNEGDIKDIHSRLMENVKIKMTNQELPNNKTYNKKLSNNNAQSIYGKIKEARSNNNDTLVLKLLDELFSFESKKSELEFLKQESECKSELLKKLREKNIFVLSQGDIESYYPDFVEGSKNEKLKMAQSYCAEVKSLDYNEIFYDEKIEFKIIFEQIFS